MAPNEKHFPFCSSRRLAWLVGRGCAHSPKSDCLPRKHSCVRPTIGFREHQKVVKWESLFLRSIVTRGASTISGKSCPRRTVAAYCENLPTFDPPSASGNIVFSSGRQLLIAKSPRSTMRFRANRFSCLLVLGIAKRPFSSVLREIVFLSVGNP